MALDKQQQFELAKIDSINTRIGFILDFIKSLGWMGCILGCTYLMFDSLKSIAQANPAAISAIADVVKNLGLGSKIGYGVTAASGGAWFLERRGKKRLLNQLDEVRKVRESKDPYRAGSGLTSSGDTPSKKRGSR